MNLEKITSLNNSIIFLEFFTTLCAAASLYFSAKILKKSGTINFNLTVFSLAIGIFIPVFVLQFGEFATISNCFLLLAFPYISYFFVKDSDLTKRDKMIVAALAIALFCLKINYGILIIALEAQRILRNRGSVFSLRNFLIFDVIVIFYALAFPEAELTHLLFKENIFPLILLLVLTRKVSASSPFFAASIAAILIVISEFGISYDQKFILYSLSLPLLLSSFFIFIKNHYFNWWRDGILLLAILIIPQFDPKTFFDFIVDACSLWPLLVLVLSKKWRRNLNQENSFLSKFLLPHNFDSWFCFLAISAISFALFFNPFFSDFAFLISVIIFILLVDFDQKLEGTKKFSSLSACTIFLVLSHFLALHLAAIFNFSESAAFKYKSPNHVSEEMARIIAKANTAQIIVNPNGFITAYPLATYMKKKVIWLSDSSFEWQLSDPQNKLIFIEKNSDLAKDRCEVSLLEKNFHNPQFKKLFLQNYVFLSRITQTKTVKKEVSFFNDEDQKVILSDTLDLIERDVDVYARR